MCLSAKPRRPSDISRRCLTVTKAMSSPLTRKRCNPRKRRRSAGRTPWKYSGLSRYPKDRLLIRADIRSVAKTKKATAHHTPTQSPACLPIRREKKKAAKSLEISNHVESTQFFFLMSLRACSLSRAAYAELNQPGAKRRAAIPSKSRRSRRKTRVPGQARNV